MMKDAAAAARFQREVEAAAKLEHTNIVTAYDADQANGVHFLVMQFVDGQDLSALVKKNGPFPVVKAVSYVLQAARGLEFAHGEGVVHRDIVLSANLLLDKKGARSKSSTWGWPGSTPGMVSLLSRNLPAPARSWEPWITWLPNKG